MHRDVRGEKTEYHILPVFCSQKFIMTSKTFLNVKRKTLLECLHETYCLTFKKKIDSPWYNEKITQMHEKYP